MKSIYAITATSVGGRNGHVISDYNLIDADIGLPESFGGTDDKHLTPEAFLAAGYAACFDNAVIHIISKERVKTGTPVITAKVDLIQLGTDSFGLAIELEVEIPGVEHKAAVEIVNKAHQICPFSNATRGNIDVKLTVNKWSLSNQIF
ncbi:MAG: organic hydroperoxide resistance protein [Mucilaginibacter sp.]|nr:organic hydroperoxide resistance protein [Mucilaginibacter sp.]